MPAAAAAAAQPRLRHPTRGRARARPRRSRFAALPQSSLFFLAAVVGLAVWFRTPDAAPRPAPDALHNSLLDITAVRSGGSDYGDLCSKGDFLSSKWSLFLLIPGVVFAFVGLAIVTDDYFVSALERICERLNLSEDVAGATFMAAGSSTPEFFASLLGVFVTEDEVGIGTIVGSAVFNILVIIGLSAALAGSVLKLDWRPLIRDSFFYVVSIVLLLVFVLGPSNGQIDWWEGLILFLTYGVYVLFMAFGNKPYMKWAGRFTFGKPKENNTPDVETGTIPNETIRAISETWSASITPNTSAEKPSDGDERSSDEEEPDARTLLGIELPSSVLGWIFFPVSFFWRLAFKLTIVDCSSEKLAHLWWLTFLLSILWISGISYIMVEAARFAGCLIGIPAPAMGLTVIAAGTSVPDALASISVARDGAGDMAVSNAIGSNVFDILLGLGFPWFIGALAKKNAIPISTTPITTVVVPILILFAIIILLVVILVLIKWQLRPLLGYILFGIYGLFVAYTLLDVYVFKFGEE